jgi:hypothetical protein
VVTSNNSVDWTAFRPLTVPRMTDKLVFAVTETRRRELTDSVRAFDDAADFAGCLGTVALASVPAERIGSLFSDIETETGLALVRVRCGWL